MQPSYASIELLTESRTWADRAPRLPMIGFLIGTGLSLLLWALIGLGTWTLLL